MEAIKCYHELNEEFIKVNKNNLRYFETIVLGKNRFSNEYFKLTLLLDNEINDQFIINVFNEVKENSKICINFEDIIFRTLNGKLFFEIKEIKKLIFLEQKTIKENFKIYCFSFHNYINSLNDLKQIKYNCLVSMPVKEKEMESFTNEPIFKFKDINKKELTINVDIKKFNVEGQKVYLLEGFLYDIEVSKFIQLPNSNIKEIKDFLYKDKNYAQSDILPLVNFKGKIKTFNFIDKIINIEIEEKQNQFEVEISDKFFTKISINCDCYFLIFQKLKKININVIILAI